MTGQGASERFKGCATLEALVLDVKNTLEAAIDKYDGIVDADVLISGKEHKDGLWPACCRLEFFSRVVV